MKHKVKTRKFDRPTAPRLAMLRNLVTDLLGYEKITTTEAKAKEVRILAERMITLGKGGTLAQRRRALALVYDEGVVDKVFKEFAIRYAGRSGGYTRILKLGSRLGDNAPMVRIELVEEKEKVKSK